MRAGGWGGWSGVRLRERMGRMVIGTRGEKERKESTPNDGRQHGGRRTPDDPGGGGEDTSGGSPDGGDSDPDSEGEQNESGSDELSE